MAEVPEPEPQAATELPRIELFMTVIRVANWSMVVRWYIDALGLVPVLLDPQHQFALLAAGNGRLGVQGVAEAQFDSVRGKVRLVFQVRDLDRERQDLAQRGIAVSSPMENREEGYREVRLNDPEGNSLRLFAWIDPARASQFAGSRP